MAATAAINPVLVSVAMFAASAIGASFCHVMSASPGPHAVPAITLGSHRWRGTLPALSISLISSALPAGKGCVVSKLVVRGVRRSIKDPAVCAMKYFVLASTEAPALVDTMIGRKQYRLISIPTHVMTQFEAERLSKVPATMPTENRKRAGVKGDMVFGLEHVMAVLVILSL